MHKKYVNIELRGGDTDMLDKPEVADMVDIMDEYFGDAPILNKARVVDGGNFEAAGSPIANEDSPVLASNLYESAPTEDEAE